MEGTNVFMFILFGFFFGIVLIVMLAAAFKQSIREMYEGNFRESRNPYYRRSGPEFEQYVTPRREGACSIWAFLILLVAFVGLFGAVTEFSGFSLRDVFSKSNLTQDKHQKQIELKENIDYDLLWVKEMLSDTNQTKGLKNVDSILYKINKIEKNIDSLQNMYIKNESK